MVKMFPEKSAAKAALRKAIEVGVADNGHTSLSWNGGTPFYAVHLRKNGVGFCLAEGQLEAAQATYRRVRA